MSSDIKIKDQKMIFLDEMMDQVIILDKFKNIFFANKSAVAGFGNDIIGKNISLILRDANLLESIDHAIHDKSSQVLDVEIKLPIFQFYNVNIIPESLYESEDEDSVIIFL